MKRMPVIRKIVYICLIMLAIRIVTNIPLPFINQDYIKTITKVEVFKVKVESTVIAITKAVSKSMCSQLYFFVERRNMLERRKVAL